MKLVFLLPMLRYHQSLSCQMVYLHNAEKEPTPLYGLLILTALILSTLLANPGEKSQSLFIAGVGHYAYTSKWFCCDLHGKCHPKNSVVKAWFLVQECSLIEVKGSDWILRAIISSKDYSIDGFTAECTVVSCWNCRTWGLLGGNRLVESYLWRVYWLLYLLFLSLTILGHSAMKQLFFTMHSSMMFWLMAISPKQWILVTISWSPWNSKPK